jgi:hypothetical protein
MATYCELIIERQKHTTNPYLFAVHLKLMNTTNGPVTMNWKVTIPEMFRLVQPANPLIGTNLLHGGVHEHVPGWVVDIAGIPDNAKSTFVTRHQVVAEISMPSEGMRDSCTSPLATK